MTKVLFEAQGVSRGDKEEPANVVAAASFPAKVTCSKSWSQVLPSVFGGYMGCSPH